MHVQIVNFKLNEMTRVEYDALLDEVAPQFPKIDGLKTKYYLADDKKNTYGGVYIWETEEAMLHYKAGEVYQSILDHPGLDEVTTTDFEVIDGHSFLDR